jgi:hypothetical protein
MFKRHVQNFRVGGAAKKNRGRPIRRTTSGSKPNYRKTKEGAGMTEAGVKAHRRANPGSTLQTAVTESKPTGKRAARRKSYCARSAGQMKQFPKAARNPNSRLRQARRRWKC